MKELFRLKIASKRQATIPQRMLNLLHLSEGDEIQIEVEDGRIRSVQPCKVVPTNLFGPEVLARLIAREAEGGGTPIDPPKLIDEAEAETAAAVPRAVAC